MAELAKKRALTRHKGRMPKADALVIWRNPKLSTDEALDLMKGWKQATAYTTFGKRFAVAGHLQITNNFSAGVSWIGWEATGTVY